MGGVDICDQMTRLNKCKKQKRWYLCVFLKIVMLSIYNAYILEGYKCQHSVKGRRKRDLLSFKQDLCIQLVEDYPRTRKSAATNKRRRSEMVEPERLKNVGAHFPFKGEGKNHRCDVCEKKHFLSKKQNPSQATARHKTTFKCSQCDVYLCIGEGGGNCFYDFHTNLEYWI